MNSLWDRLPEEIEIKIYKINHGKLMNNLVNEINKKNKVYHLCKYYTEPIYNFWYMGVGLKSLKEKFWINAMSYHSNYKTLYEHFNK